MAALLTSKVNIATLIKDLSAGVSITTTTPVTQPDSQSVGGR